MKSRTLLYSMLALAVAALLISVRPSRATVESWTQTLQNDLAAGPSAKGSDVLQIGKVSTLSGLASDTTLISLVAAPATGKTYLRGIWIEKSTTDTGSVTLTFGTTNVTPCDTGATSVTLSAATGQTLKFGYTPLEIQVPAGDILCGSTDAATTAFRVLAQ